MSVVRPVIIKLGGSSLESLETIELISKSINKIKDQKIPIVLIHGGGPAINAALTEKNIVWEFIEGQRKTTQEMMGIIETTLFGVVNRRLQTYLSQSGISVLGISGSDADLLQCSALSDDLGLVGQVQKINSSLLQGLIALNVVPLVCPIGVDENKRKYNINADLAAAHIAIGLNAQKLIYMTDQDGIWDQNKVVIPQIDSLGLYQLMQTKVVQGGMLVKVKSVLQALREGVEEVDIISAQKSNTLTELIINKGSVGTRCYQN